MPSPSFTPWSRVESDPDFSSFSPEQKKTTFDNWREQTLGYIEANPDEFDENIIPSLKSLEKRKLPAFTGSPTAQMEADNAPNAVMAEEEARRKRLEQAETEFARLNELRMNKASGLFSGIDQEELTALEQKLAGKEDSLTKLQDVLNNDEDYAIVEGQFIPSPRLTLDKDAYNKAVRAADLDREERIRALLARDSNRERAGQAMYASIKKLGGLETKLEQADGSFMGVPVSYDLDLSEKFRNFEDVYRQKNAGKDFTEADIMAAWAKENSGMFDNAWTQIKGGVYKAAVGTIQGYYGLKQLLNIGDQEEAQAAAKIAGEIYQDVAEATETMGGATGIGTASEIVAGTAFTMPTGFGGRVAVAAGQQVAKLAGRAAFAATGRTVGKAAVTEAAKKAALTRAAKLQTAGGVAAAGLGAGLQQAGGAYNTYKEEYLQQELQELAFRNGVSVEELSDEDRAEAEEAAVTSATYQALRAGFVEGVITMIGGASGAEAFARSPAPGALREIIREGTTKYLTKTVGKEIVGEAVEEGSIALTNGLLDLLSVNSDKLSADPVGALTELAGQTFESAAWGGALGGGMSSLKATVDVLQAKREIRKSPALTAMSKAVAELRKAGMTQTADALASKRDEEEARLVDEKLNEADEKALASIEEEGAPPAPAPKPATQYRPAGEYLDELEQQRAQLGEGDDTADLDAEIDRVKTTIAESETGREAMVEVTPAEEAGTAPAPVQPPAPVKTDEDIAGEPLSAITARTPVGPEREKAISERRQAAVRLADSLQSGDKVIDDSGEEWVVDGKVINGKGFIKGGGDSVDFAAILTSSSARDSQGNQIELPAGKIVRKTSTAPSQPAALQPGTPAPVQPPTPEEPAAPPAKAKRGQKKKEAPAAAAEEPAPAAAEEPAPAAAEEPAVAVAAPAKTKRGRKNKEAAAAAVEEPAAEEPTATVEEVQPAAPRGLTEEKVNALQAGLRYSLEMLQKAETQEDIDLYKARVQDFTQRLRAAETTPQVSPPTPTTPDAEVTPTPAAEAPVSETEEPPTGGLPPVEGEPPVAAPAAEAPEGAKKRGRQGAREKVAPAPAAEEPAPARPAAKMRAKTRVEPPTAPAARKALAKTAAKTRALSPVKKVVETLSKGVKALKPRPRKLAAELTPAQKDSLVVDDLINESIQLGKIPTGKEIGDAVTLARKTRGEKGFDFNAEAELLEEYKTRAKEKWESLYPPEDLPEGTRTRLVTGGRKDATNAVDYNPAAAKDAKARKNAEDRGVYPVKLVPVNDLLPTQRAAPLRKVRPSKRRLAYEKDLLASVEITARQSRVEVAAKAAAQALLDAAKAKMAAALEVGRKAYTKKTPGWLHSPERKKITDRFGEIISGLQANVNSFPDVSTFYLAPLFTLEGRRGSKFEQKGTITITTALKERGTTAAVPGGEVYYVARDSKNIPQDGAEVFLPALHVTESRQEAELFAKESGGTVVTVKTNEAYVNGDNRVLISSGYTASVDANGSVTLTPSTIERSTDAWIGVFTNDPETTALQLNHGRLVIIPESLRATLEKINPLISFDPGTGRVTSAFSPRIGQEVENPGDYTPGDEVYRATATKSLEQRMQLEKLEQETGMTYLEAEQALAQAEKRLVEAQAAKHAADRSKHSAARKKALEAVDAARGLVTRFRLAMQRQLPAMLAEDYVSRAEGDKVEGEDAAVQSLLVGKDDKGKSTSLIAQNIETLLKLRGYPLVRDFLRAGDYTLVEQGVENLARVKMRSAGNQLTAEKVGKNPGGVSYTLTEEVLRALNARLASHRRGYTDSLHAEANENGTPLLDLLLDKDLAEKIDLKLAEEEAAAPLTEDELDEFGTMFRAKYSPSGVIDNDPLRKQMAKNPVMVRRALDMWKANIPFNILEDGTLELIRGNPLDANEEQELRDNLGAMLGVGVPGLPGAENPVDQIVKFPTVARFVNRLSLDLREQLQSKFPDWDVDRFNLEQLIRHSGGTRDAQVQHIISMSKQAIFDSEERSADRQLAEVNWLRAMLALEPTRGRTFAARRAEEGPTPTIDPEAVERQRALEKAAQTQMLRDDAVNMERRLADTAAKLQLAKESGAAPEVIEALETREQLLKDGLASTRELLASATAKENLTPVGVTQEEIDRTKEEVRRRLAFTGTQEPEAPVWDSMAALRALNRNLVSDQPADIPEPAASAEEVAQMRADLERVGLPDNATDADLRKALTTLATRSGPGSAPPRIKTLAMLLSNAIAATGITKVTIIEDPSVSFDADVVNDTLVVNLSQVPSGTSVFDSIIRESLRSAVGRLSNPSNFGALNEAQQEAMQALENLRAEAEQRNLQSGVPVFWNETRSLNGFLDGVFNNPEFVNFLNYRTGAQSKGLRGILAQVWQAITILVTGKGVKSGSAAATAMFEASRLFAAKPPKGAAMWSALSEMFANPEAAFPNAVPRPLTERVKDKARVALAEAGAEPDYDRNNQTEEVEALEELVAEGASPLVASGSGAVNADSVPVPLVANARRAEADKQGQDADGKVVMDTINEVFAEAGVTPVYVKNGHSSMYATYGDERIFVDAEQLRADVAGLLGREGATKEQVREYIRAAIREELDHIAVASRFRLADILVIANQMTDAEVAEILRVYHKIDPTDPANAEQVKRLLGIAEGMTNAEIVQAKYTLVQEHLRRYRQKASSGFTTEDRDRMVGRPDSFVSRGVDYLRGLKRRFAARWQAYGDPAALRSILNTDDFLAAIGADPGNYSDTVDVDFEGNLLAASTGNVTPEQDAEYLDAVARGDMETAQRLVDEAAKAAGYNVGPVWHYTAGDSADFTQFDKTKAELGAFFFSPENKNMTGRRGAKLKGQFYLSLNNPRVVTESKSVGGVDNPMAYYSSEGLSSRGFDGIVGTKGLPEGGRGVAEYLVFDPNQIKSADPITYDDNGNVTPLSQRFDVTSPLIARARRVDSSGQSATLSDAEIEKRMQQAKLGGAHGAWISPSGEIARVATMYGHADVIEAIAKDIKISNFDDYRKAYDKNYIRVVNTPEVIYLTSSKPLSVSHKSAADYLGMMNDKNVVLDVVDTGKQTLLYKHTPPYAGARRVAPVGEGGAPTTAPVTGPLRRTAAGKEMLKVLPDAVREVLGQTEYWTRSMPADQKFAAEAVTRTGGDVAETAVEFDAAMKALSKQDLTGPQEMIARALLQVRANLIHAKLKEEMDTTPSVEAARDLDQLQDFIFQAARTELNARSTAGTALQVFQQINAIYNPAIKPREYTEPFVKAVKEKIKATPGAEEAVAKIRETVKKARTTAAEKTVKGSELPRKIAAAALRKLNLKESAGQSLFDFMADIEALQGEMLETMDEKQFLARFSGGLPIRVQIANWAAKKLVDRTLKEFTSKAATAEQKGVLEELGNEVRDIVAKAFDAEFRKLNSDEQAKPSKDSMARLIFDINHAELLTEAVNQARERILAKAALPEGATAEQTAAYNKTVEAARGLTFDSVLATSAHAVIRRTFRMRQELAGAMDHSAGSIDMLSKLAQELGDLNPAQADAVAKVLIKAYREEAAAEAKRELDNLAKSKLEKTVGDRELTRLSKSERLIRLIRLGAFSDETYYNALAEEYDLPVYDPAVLKEIERKALDIGGMPVGSVQRVEMVRNLNADILRATLDTLLDHYGVTGFLRNKKLFTTYTRDIPLAMWKSGILSGYGTAQVNFAAGALQSTMDLSHSAIGYGLAAKDPALMAKNFGYLLKEFLTLGGSETLTEVRRAAATGSTRFISEQAEHRLILEQDLPMPPVMKQAAYFYKVIGRLISIIDATVSVPAYRARQQMAMAYALSQEGVRGKELRRIIDNSFSPEGEMLAKIEKQLDAEQRQFNLLPRPDLVRASRRNQLLEQERAKMIEEIGGEEDIIEAGREASRMANLSGRPQGIAGAFFDGLFGTLERKTGGLTAPIMTFTRSLGNLFDFSLAMSIPGIPFLRANNKSLSNLLPSGLQTYARKRVEPGSVEYYKLNAQGAVAMALQVATLMLFMQGMEDEEEGKVPFFMVYGKGYDDPDKNAQLRLRQPRWFPDSVKIGPLHLSWKDVPGLNILFGGMAGISDARLKNSTKNLDRIRAPEFWVSAGHGTLRSAFVKNAMTSLENVARAAGEGATASQSAVRFLTGIPAGITTPRLIGDVANVARGLASETGDYAIYDRNSMLASVVSMMPVSDLYADKFGVPKMLNARGVEVTNHWYAPLVKRVAPAAAEEGYDPIITPLASAGLFLNPPDGGSLPVYVYEDRDSDTFSEEAVTLSMFGPEVKEFAVKMYGELMTRGLENNGNLQKLTDYAGRGKQELEAAQEELSSMSTLAKRAVQRALQRAVKERKFIPHFQEE